MAPRPELLRLSTQEVVDEYLADVAIAVASGTLRATTSDTYKRDMKDFLAFTDTHAIFDDLTAPDIDEILLSYLNETDRRFSKHETRQKGKSAGTGARFRQSITRLFAFAERRNYIEYNPMPDVRVKPKPGDRRDARLAMSKESSKALLTAPSAHATAKPPRKHQDVRARDELILRVLIEVGPRVAELCALDLGDVESVDGSTWLRIRDGKGGKGRGVPLAPSTALLLSMYIEPRKQALEGSQSHSEAWQSNPLFLTFRGRRIAPRDVQNLVKRACASLPPEVRRDATPHALRHTMATLLLSSGAADVKVVQKLLGHVSLSTTGIYLDEISEELVYAVAHHPVTGGP